MPFKPHFPCLIAHQTKIDTYVPIPTDEIIKAPTAMRHTDKITIEM